MFFFDFGKVFSHKIECFILVCWFEFIVFFDKRCCELVIFVDEIEIEVVFYICVFVVWDDVDFVCDVYDRVCVFVYLEV